jgi:hypothetical protein
VTSPNIILLPILIIPEDRTVDSAEQIQFEAKGGFGTYVWTIDVDNSGASINGSGLYTAGAGTGVDTIQVEDEEGHTTTVDVTVI